jgi:glycosyltransferase involved in cell wall biosynthesis
MPLHHPCWDGPGYAGYDAIYREADAVIAMTEHEARTLVERKGVRPDRIHVTGAAPVLAEQFSVERFRRTYGIHGPYVLFLGRHVRHKGFEALIRAAPKVWRRFPEAMFVFVGPRTPRSWAAWARARDKRLRSTGAVNEQTKAAALAGCELLCVPSTQESFGIVYCEAWAFGKPVVGGRIGPVASVVDDGRDGLLSSQDPHELAEKICWLLGQPALAAAMGERGRRKVAERYTWPRLAQKTLRVYESLLRTPPGPTEGAQPHRRIIGRRPGLRWPGRTGCTGRDGRRPGLRSRADSSSARTLRAATRRRG